MAGSEWGLSHMYESCHIWMGLVMYRWVTHTRPRPSPTMCVCVAHLYITRVLSLTYHVRVCMHAFTGVNLHIWRDDISAHTHTQQMSTWWMRDEGVEAFSDLTMEDSDQFDIWMSLVTWRIQMCHDLSICDMTHTHVTWRIHMWHDSFICDMTHTYVTWLKLRVIRDTTLFK